MEILGFHHKTTQPVSCRHAKEQQPNCGRQLKGYEKGSQRHYTYTCLISQIRIFYLATDYSLRELCWDAAVNEKGFDTVDDGRRKIWTLTTPPPASIGVTMANRQNPLGMSPTSDLAAFTVESPTLQVKLYAQNKNFAITEFTHVCMSMSKDIMRS